jgi:hypothetical protein
MLKALLLIKRRNKMNDPDKISAHIAYSEAIYSETAIRNGISNTPTPAILEQMRITAENTFEKARNHFDVPIFVSSFFRSDKVNELTGGSDTSQHTKGQAIDADADRYGRINNQQLFDYIRDNCDFDQLIWEFENPDGTCAWVHMSYVSADKNRHQILRSKKTGNKTTYEPYT